VVKLYRFFFDLSRAFCKKIRFFAKKVLIYTF
jgi:hypothetical protein